MVVASAFRAVVPLGGTLGGVVLGLVPVMSSLGVFHVGVFIDNRHHVANGLGVALCWRSLSTHFIIQLGEVLVISSG